MSLYSIITRLNHQLYKYGILVSLFILVIIIPIISQHFSVTSDNIAKSSAVRDAEQIAKSLKAFRYLYTSDVVDNVQGISDINVTHDFN